MTRPCVIYLLLAIVLPAAARAQQTGVSASATEPLFDERFDAWPVDLKINGQVIVTTALSDALTLEEILPKDASDERLLLLADATESETLRDAYLAAFDSVVSHTLTDEKNEPIDVEDLQWIVWHSSESFDELPDSTVESLCNMCKGHVAAGGKLLVIGPACEMLGRYYAQDSGDEDRPLRSGCNLLPDCILHAESATKPVPGLPPGCVGIGLESDTALVLSGRKLRVLGPGKATVAVGRDGDAESWRYQSIQAAKRNQRPKHWLIDLTQWRRQAMDLTLEPFPPSTPRTPYVDQGALLIVGGGGMPDGLMERFIEFAGGKENARLVYVPCSEEDAVREQQSMVRSWQKLGVQHATFIHTKDRIQANEDEAFLEPLKNATGIWFGGGRQWNFSDSYYGTAAHRLMKETLTRGGVIGGSSAGASIQARYLARATPIENFDIMAPGYERGGLGFIGGVAIDQHFSQRGRQKDMTELVDRYPQLLGIGIDETTAIIVQKSIAEVVGKGKVHFYNRDVPTPPGEPDFIALEAGEKYDLANRHPVTE